MYIKKELEVLNNYLFIHRRLLFKNIVNQEYDQCKQNFANNLSINYDKMCLSDHTAVKLSKMTSKLSYDIISYNILNSTDPNIINVFIRETLKQIYKYIEKRKGKKIPKKEKDKIDNIIFEAFQEKEDKKNEKLVEFVLHHTLKQTSPPVFLFQEVSDRCLLYLKKNDIIKKYYHIFSTTKNDQVYYLGKPTTKIEKRVTLVPKSFGPELNDIINKYEIKMLNTDRLNNTKNIVKKSYIKNGLAIKIGTSLIYNLHNHYLYGQNNMQFLLEQLLLKHHLSKIIMMGDFNNSKEHILSQLNEIMNSETHHLLPLRKKIKSIRVIGASYPTFFHTINNSNKLDNAVVIDLQKYPKKSEKK